MLDTSRIEAGTFSYAFTDVDLGELVRDTVATVSLGQDEVPVVAKTPGSLPPVRGDRERLRQVLMNLVDNAVKYSQAGDEVAVSAWAENGQVLVSVEDHGPGIPREQHGLIFEKFGRANVGRRGSRARASASSSRARSPRRTAARSRFAPPRPGARPSRSPCRSRQLRL